MTRVSTNAPSGSSPPGSVRLLAILGALSAFGPMCTDLYLPALPGVADDLGAQPSHVQLTLTMFLVGLAVGQVFVGPLSDSVGRRPPLLVSMGVFTVTSFACALAPSVHVLVALRLVQGLAGAAGVVIARAIVRDIASGARASRYYSVLMAVVGLAPVIAPLIGGQMLRVTSWRGLFVVLGAVGAALGLTVAAGVRETLPAPARRAGSVRDTWRTITAIARNRRFAGYALSGALSFAAMFAYISGSSFVYQDIYGVSPQLYSVLFAMNGVGLVGANYVNGWLAGRVDPRVLLDVGLGGVFIAGASLVAVVGIGGLGLAGLLPSLFVLVASFGFVMPNATALALHDHPGVAGSASALLGFLQFLLGALVAPLAGVGGATALGMAAVIAAMGVLAVSARISLVPRVSRR